MCTGRRDSAIIIKTTFKTCLTICSGCQYTVPPSDYRHAVFEMKNDTKLISSKYIPSVTVVLIDRQNKNKYLLQKYLVQKLLNKKNDQPKNIKVNMKF